MAGRSSRLACSHRITTMMLQCVSVTCVHRICSTYAGAMMLAVPGGQVVSAAPHLLRGQGLSCGERKGAQSMLLITDDARLRARHAIANAHMDT
jgi:hypothetical protein